MEDSSDELLTAELLGRTASGDRQAIDVLFRRVHAELKRIAQAQMQRERSDHTLTPTALVNEAYLKLVSHTPDRLENRKHFYSIAARAMRQVLVDHAERRSTAKRGGALQRVTFDENHALSCRAENVIALNQALERLERVDPATARVVELRFFAGLEQKEIASLLGVSTTTVKRQWRTARAWLKEMMDRNPD